MHKIISITCLTVLLLLVAGSINAKDVTDPVEKILTIGEAVKKALENNYKMSAAREQELGATEFVKSSKAALLPSVSADYSYTGFNKQPYAMSSGIQMNTAHKNLYEWNITVVQPLFTGFALKTQLELARNDKDLKNLAMEQTRLDVIQMVKTAYYEALLTEKIRNVAEESLSALKSHVNDAAKFYEVGLIPHNDLLKSQVALAQAEQTLERVNADVALGMSRLNILMAEDLRNVIKLQEYRDIVFFDGELGSLMDTALESRPEIRAADLMIDSKDKSITLEKSSFYPQVSLVGSYGRDGKDYRAEENDYSNSYNSVVMVQAGWTLFEWGKTRSKVSGLNHEKTAIEQDVEDLKDGIRMQVQQAFLGVNVSGENIKTAEKALAQAEENWRITKLQYDQQLVNSTEVLDARTYLTQANSDYFQAVYGYAISLCALERAVGLI